MRAMFVAGFVALTLGGSTRTQEAVYRPARVSPILCSLTK